ncbi:MAG: hypothetical protein HOK30_25320 [Rhodospirillaceae bacterium]|jgi:hypothetical protein|nr:hypothetical protein [Rhodospirillaceae bacterium]MBT5192834.1 hypothetical protein [Rhodospirillaceae bacterium]MBT5896748.1 hypothetical protein [Rhodospirillaceae bacterium]MBT6431013.1 hypothetical protein [Rhodospirillaceae bacterium]MBT7760484.1 hypothetical protein [Rhodospirillaceae bacterium]
MAKIGNRHLNPDDILRKLRARVLGGGRPVLDSLTADEMVAAHEMISQGEAEIASYSCRLFLIAKLHDQPSGLEDLLAATKRFLGNR